MLKNALIDPLFMQFLWIFESESWWNSESNMPHLRS